MLKAARSASPPLPLPSLESLALARRSQIAFVRESPCRPMLYDLLTYLSQRPAPPTPQGQRLMEYAWRVCEHPCRHMGTDEGSCLRVLRAFHRHLCARKAAIYTPPAPPSPYPQFRDPQMQLLFDDLDALIRRADRLYLAEQQAALAAEQRRYPQVRQSVRRSIPR